MTQAICQSCGKPLSKDALGGGTNADGTKSSEYCSECYQYGSFTEPWLSPEQMRARAKGRLIEKNIPAFVAGLFVKDLSKLKRWNSPRQGQFS